MFSAVLDTCVLWPSLQRDLLLSMAAHSVYRPLWSADILDELLECEVAKLDARKESGDASARAQSLISTMTDAFTDALVQGTDLLRPIGLPDPDDEHVAAAAVLGGAGAIVTENVRDFPSPPLPQGVLVLRPAEFTHDMVVAEPIGCALALLALSDRYVNPARTPDKLLEMLVARYQMDAAVGLLRPVVDTLLRKRP